MSEVIAVSGDTARRFILGKQGLWPARRWEGKDGVRRAVHAMEHLQLDPVVIVARSHDLMLHSRVAGYRAEHFDELVHRDREFFDWGGWLAVRPMEELPYWRVFMRRNRDHGRTEEMGASYAPAIVEMRARLQAGELILSREVEADGEAKERTYRGSKDGSLALYYLWRTGEAMTYERRGFERVYASAERVAPAALLTEVDEHEAELFLIRKAISAEGIGRSKQVSIWFARTVPRNEMEALEAELVERGDLTRVIVEGWKGPQFIATSDLPELEAVAEGSIPAAWGVEARDACTLLSPLDPVSARGRAATVFGFDYVWEIYKRQAEVKYGRYTMPILFRDQLVGRVDLKADRVRRKLLVNGLWFEDGQNLRDEELHLAVGNEMERLLSFLGLDELDTSALEAPLAEMLRRP